MIRPVAQRFFEACQAQDRAKLSPACYVDFSIDSDPATFKAFCEAVKRGCTARELDDALGYGGRLTKLLHKYGQTHVTIAPTSYDEMEVPEYNKVTVGFVTQKFVRDEDGYYHCTEQNFTAGDEVNREVYDEEEQESIDISHTLQLRNEVYEPFNMAKPARTTESV